MGVRVTTVDRVLAERDNLPIDHGAIMVDVIANGPTDRAGLKSGDVIVQVDKHEVNDVASLGDALLSKEIISDHGNLDEDTTMKIGVGQIIFMRSGARQRMN